MTWRGARHFVRVAVLGWLRRMLSSRVVFRVLGVPAGKAEIERFAELVIYPTSMRAIPPPKTIDDQLHPKFVPGSDPRYHGGGWLFERSFLICVPNGISRATGVNLTATGDVIDLGPGLTPPPSTYRALYRPLSQMTYVDEAVATLTVSWDANYFHWLFDVLARVHLVEASGKHPLRLYASLRYPFQRDSLSRLGYRAESIVDAGIVPQVSAREMVVASLPGIPGVIPGWACAFLRKRLLSPTAPEAQARPRLYISRASARTRRIANEPGLLDVLARYGFTGVSLETLTFADQVRLFRSAECVIGPHGAGLANLVFCAPGTPVIEILPSKDTNVCYWILSQHVGLDYHYLTGSTTGPGGDIHVDVEKLTRTLDTALTRGGAATAPGSASTVAARPG